MSSLASEAKSPETGFGTRAIHAGQPADPQTGSVCVPINLSTTYVQSKPGVHKGYEYSRTGNPTRHALQECIAGIENGKHGLAFASGSAATSAVIHLLQSGEHMVCADDVYGGTNRYLRRVVAPQMNITTTFVDMTVDGELEKGIVAGKTKLLWVETPSNPTLKVVDIKKIVKIGHEAGLTVCVDNTFATPYFQNPLDLGADIVLHSATKYINGHSDIVCGLIATNNQEIRDKLAFIQNGVGAVPSPFDCYMVLRGIKTLHLRMQRHGENAMVVAKFLEGHEKVERVFYPGLPSHPQHELAKRQMKNGFGGMVTAILKGGVQQGEGFLTSLKLFALAESLGAVECLAESPVIMTHASVPVEQRAKLGIDDSLVRLSVGVESIEDILDDLKSALDATPAV